MWHVQCAVVARCLSASRPWLCVFAHVWLTCVPAAVQHAVHAGRGSAARAAVCGAGRHHEDGAMADDVRTPARFVAHSQRRACARHLAYAGRSRATNAPPAGAGRNFWEVLRVLDSLQLTTLYDVGTPAHWKAPEDCYVLPHVADEAAAHVSPGVRHVPAANLSLTRSPSPGVCPPRCSLEA